MSIARSPILHRPSCEVWYAFRFWREENDRAWLCYKAVAKLFDLRGAEQIRIVASSQPHEDRYLIEIVGNTVRIPEVSLITSLVSTFCWWANRQISEGRNYFGIEIVKRKVRQ
jgi:hypothetical protein